MNLEQQILELGKRKLEYYKTLDEVSSIDLPIGKITLNDGTEAQVVVKVTTEKTDFNYCIHYK